MKKNWLLAAVVAGVTWFALVELAAQAPAYRGPRTPDGKPDLNGIWQVLNEANFNLEPHSAQMGIQAGMGVVEGDLIPFTPDAAKKRKENYENRFAADPLNKCYLPGVPRATYLPYPFEIHQSPKYVVMASAFHATPPANTTAAATPRAIASLRILAS